jgi:hypothetical protein
LILALSGTNTEALTEANLPFIYISTLIHKVTGVIVYASQAFFVPSIFWGSQFI